MRLTMRAAVSTHAFGETLASFVSLGQAQSWWRPKNRASSPNSRRVGLWTRFFWLLTSFRLLSVSQAWASLAEMVAVKRAQPRLASCSRSQGTDSETFKQRRSTGIWVTYLHNFNSWSSSNPSRFRSSRKSRIKRLIQRYRLKHSSPKSGISFHQPSLILQKPKLLASS